MREQQNEKRYDICQQRGIGGFAAADADVKKGKLNREGQWKKQHVETLPFFDGKTFVGQTGPQINDQWRDAKAYAGGGKHSQTRQTDFDRNRIGAEQDADKDR